MNFLPIRQLPRPGRPLAQLVPALALAGILGCAPTVQEEQAANARPVRSADEEVQAKEKLAPMVAIKESPLQGQAFRVEDLSVKEEQGQTTLTIKFSEPVSQYRHFPLSQPARVVLDVFGRATAMPEVESFRSETHWLSFLRLSSGAGHLRLVMEIAAAEAPAYVIEADSS